MKYFVIITLTLGLQFLNCVSQRHSRQQDYYDYGDDADPSVGFEEEYQPPKTIYKLADAPKLFEKFIKDFNKKYKDERDRTKHYNTFVESLKEINTLNSDKSNSATFGINMFADLSADEKALFQGTGEFNLPKSTSEKKSAPNSFVKSRDNNKGFPESPGSGPPKSIVYQHENAPTSFKKISDYDTDFFSDPIIEPLKPIYRLEDAPKLFEKFIEDFNKVYKNEKDRLKHYNTFVKNLKEINAFNSNKEFSDTVEIDIFTDLSPAEKHILHP